VKLTLRLKGGLGSGHRGHRGRPGEVGGSTADDTPPPAEYFLNAPEVPPIDIQDRRRYDFQKKFPDLYALIGDKVVLEADVSDETVLLHLSDLNGMPRNILRKLKDAGYVWFIGNKPVTQMDNAQRLRGIVPRGWERSGRTWDDVAGMCNDHDKNVLLGKGAGATWLAQHETGHAIWDVFVRGRRLDTYYRPLLVAYRTIPENKLRAYFKQPNGVGFSELFCSSFGYKYGASTAYMTQNTNKQWADAFNKAVQDMFNDFE